MVTRNVIRAVLRRPHRHRPLFQCFVLLVALHLCAAAAFAQTTVSFRFWGNQQTADAMAILAQDFERENPGIKIELIHSPSGGPDNLVVAVAGGIAPDASMAHAAYWAPLWEAIQPLDKLIESFPNLRRENFIAEKWDRNVMFGRLMGLPLRLTARINVYNKDAFDQAGIAEAPKTWAEIADYAARLTRYEGDRVARWGFGISGGGGINVPPGNFAARNGWRPFEPDFSKQNYLDPKLVETLEYLNGMVTSGIAGISQIGHQGTTDIAADRAAMVFQGSWWPLETVLPNNPGLRLGYFAIPVGPSGAAPYGIVSGEEVIMLRSAKDKEATLKFLEYLVYTRNGDYARLAGAFLPVAWHALRDPYWDTELWRALIDSFGNDSGILPAVSTTSGSAFTSAIEAIYRQQKAVTQALSEVAELAEADVRNAQEQLAKLESALRAAGD